MTMRLVLLEALLSYKLVVDAKGEMSVSETPEQRRLGETDPFLANSSKCLPFSATLPSRRTYCTVGKSEHTSSKDAVRLLTITSAAWMVERRWATAARGKSTVRGRSSEEELEAHQ